jgi:fused signal recognition particle receptor
MTLVYILIGLVVVAVVGYFVFFRSREGMELQPPTSRRGPPAEKRQEAPRPEKPAAPAARPEAKVVPEALPSSEVIAEEPHPVQAAVSARPQVKRDVSTLRKGLAATRGGFIAKLTALFAGKKEFDPALLLEIEEVMLASDVGVKTTQTILARLREALDKN